jgi:hypothetical protein
LVWPRALSAAWTCGIWSAGRLRAAQTGAAPKGVDEIHSGKKQKFLMETGEPQWFGRKRKKETLDAFFNEELSARQRRGIEAVCVDMWEPYRLSLEQWVPNCRIVYEPFGHGLSERRGLGRGQILDVAMAGGRSRNA